MIRLLLQSKFLIWKNSVFRGGLRRSLGRVVWYGFSAYLFVLILLGARSLFALVQDAGPAVLSAAFSALITFTLFWGLGSVLAQLYLSSDMELLLAAPLRRLDVFVVKLLEGVWAAVTPAALALAVLLAYGMAMRAGVPYYIWAVVALLALLILLVALSMLLVMGVMRAVPARRAREILALVWVLFFGALWFGWMLLSGRGNVVTALAGSQQTLVSVGRAAGWSPAGWVAGSVTAIAAGDWGKFALLAALLLAATALVAGLAYWVYERTFYRAWATLREGAARARAATTPQAQQASRQRGLLGWVQPAFWPAGELAVKEWVMLPRDLHWLSRLVMPLAVAGFYVYSLGFSAEGVRHIAGMPFWLSALIAPLMVWMLASSLCLPALAREGANIALLRAAPLSAAGILWGKVAATAPLVLGIALLATLIAGLLMGTSAGQLGFSLLQCVWLALLYSAAGVAAGGLSPDYYNFERNRRPAGLVGSYALLGVVAVLTVSHMGLIAALVALLAPASAEAAILTARLGPEFGMLLTSAWSAPLFVVAYALSIGALAALWKMSARRLTAWEPG